MCAAFSPSGQYVIISNFVGELALWEIASGKNIWNIQLESGKITSLFFSPNNDSFLAGYDDALFYSVVDDGLEGIISWVPHDGNAIRLQAQGWNVQSDEPR